MVGFRFPASSIGPASRVSSLRTRFESWLEARFAWRSPSSAGSGSPTYSIIVRGGAPDDIGTTLESIRRQRGAHSEVIISSAELQSPGDLQPTGIRRFQPALGLKLDKQAELRAIIANACGDFVLVLDAGDELLPGALECFSRCIERSDPDLVYGDEAYADDRNANMRPMLKPGWSPDLLTSYDYLGHATVIRRSVALDSPNVADGEPPPVGQAAQEWDLKLEVAARSRKIERIPKILCRRNGLDSPRDILVRESPHLAAVLTAYWKRRGREARVEATSDGSFRASWPLHEEPLVSVIIPSKNNAALLRTCVGDLLDRTNYTKIELIVVDNGSTEADSLSLHEEIEKRGVRLVPFAEPFNYSRACNLGAKEAKGDLLLFLNNDIEVVDGDWLTTLVREALRPDIGVVGPKLVYPDGDIQHAGVALGLFELAAHVFLRAPHGKWGPFGSPDTKRNCLAVTGACQLMRRQIFDLVAGYDEDAFTIAYSDIVLCLDAWRLGFHTLYVPAAVLVHHEGASRGFANPPSDQAVFARRLRALGIAEDPYFHPDLHKSDFIPTFVEPGANPVDPMPMRECIERIAGTRPPDACPDVYDDGAVADAIDTDWTSVAERFDVSALDPGAGAGAAILIALLRRRRDLRSRFPLALSEGARGDFARWVKSEGLALLGLRPDLAASIDAAFNENPGTRALKYLVRDPEFRQANPLFLVPNGRCATCAHLFKAVANGTLGRTDVWWFLLQSAEAPLDSLCETWSVTPDWQRQVPDGATAVGVTRLVRWVADTYAIDDDWLYEQHHPRIMGDAEQLRLAYATNAAWRQAFPHAMTSAGGVQDLLAHLSAPSSGLPFLGRDWAARADGASIANKLERPGLNILGHFSYPSGLRTSTESIVSGLESNDVDLSLRDVPTFRDNDELTGPFHRGVEIHDTTLIHVQPDPFFNEAYERAGLEPRSPRTYRIGFWYWELEDVPSSWNRAAFECDEIWTATNFVAEGLRRRFHQPVKTFLPGVEIPKFEHHTRRYFGLPDNRFVFLFIFHMTSVIDRKNPFGLIKAFRAAFSREEPVDLVIKTTFGSGHPEQFPLLADAARAAEVTLIDKEFSRDETLSLIEVSDAYVSLHRSEGLGLSMAEAMLLERPVIATRYSGNLEFMTDENSLLVDSRLVAIGEDIPPYGAGNRWADPSTEIAAAHMRRLYEDRSFARRLGTFARKDMEARLNYRTAGAAMARRLREIKAMR